MFHVKHFTSKTQKLGEKGENEAIKYLENKGFTIIERNIGNIFGEIDIVAKKKSEYYFFEVKAGWVSSFISPAENLTKEKLRKFLKSVEYYVLLNKIKSYHAKAIIVIFAAMGEVRIEVLNIS